MAANFRVCRYQSEGSMHLKLLGDLDNSSAIELIDILKKDHPGLHKIFIHTACLEHVNQMACGVLRSNLPSLKTHADRIAITGEFAGRMAPTEEYLI